MSNEEKREILGDSGVKVHYYNLWDKVKGKLLISVIASFILASFTGNYGTVLFIFFPIYLLVSIAKLLLVFLNILPLMEPLQSVVATCPYCGEKSDWYIPSLKMECPKCKKEFGFMDGNVYKITKENEKCFESQFEKTNRLLEEQSKSEEQSKEDYKSNFQQLKELKELLDLDIITQEEFNEKKKELLK